MKEQPINKSLAAFILFRDRAGKLYAGDDLRDYYENKTSHNVRMHYEGCVDQYLREYNRESKFGIVGVSSNKVYYPTKDEIKDLRKG